MIVTTTNQVEGRSVLAYHGLVTGEAVMGANIFRDLFASITDIVGGRSGAYEKELKKARDVAVQEMIEEAEGRGCNAILGVDLDYETVGDKGSMLMVTVAGTAVQLD